MKFLLLAACAAVTLTLSTCTSVPEPVCQSNILVPISKIVGPRTAAINQTVTYTLTYDLGNSCGTFGNLATNTIMNADGTTTQQVGVSGKYNGCSCTAASAPAQTAYQFQPTKAGTYYFQFLVANSQFTTDTLTVQ